MFRVFWIGTTDLSKTKKVKAPLKRKVCVSLHPKTEGTVFSNYIRKVKVMTDVSNHFFSTCVAFAIELCLKKTAIFWPLEKQVCPSNASNWRHNYAKHTTKNVLLSQLSDNGLHVDVASVVRKGQTEKSFCWVCTWI